jgi:hypothetical protein
LATLHRAALREERIEHGLRLLLLQLLLLLLLQLRWVPWKLHLGLARVDLTWIHLALRELRGVVGLRLPCHSR